jgi:hypothetical protein
VLIVNNPDPPPNKPPVFLEVLPADVTPDTWIGTTVEFSVSATDPDGDNLTYQFSVDDSVVTATPRYVHSAVETGTRHVVATATDGELIIDNEWWLSVAALPDSVAPAEVTILSVEPGFQPHEIEIRWFAVGDDGMVGRAASYIVGMSNLPIEGDADWASAEKRTVDGSSAEPGSVMQLVDTRAAAAGYTAVMVRAVDEQSNISPLGQYASGYARGYSYSGEVTNVFTGEPVAGAVVTGGTRSTTAGPDGRWELTEMSVVDGGLLISDDGVTGPFGLFFDYRIDDPNRNGAYYSIKLIPMIQLESTVYPDFMFFFIGITAFTGPPNTHYPSYQRHWELPIDLYVTPFERGTLDYKAAIERVAVDLATDIGFDAFRIVDAPPAVGIDIFYLSDDDPGRDNYSIYEWTEDAYPVRGRIEFRSVYEPHDLQVFERVIRHELGHALGLTHSEDGDRHLMVGGLLAPQVDTFSADEVAALQIIYSLPRGYPDGAYLRD